VPAWIAHIIVPAGFLVIAYRFVISAIRKAFGREIEPERGSFV
jgi:TRAP-type C4-dicarboxylate transport system permease small subunit